MLLIELISISNMGVSLIETCLCSRLYSIMFLAPTMVTQRPIILVSLGVHMSKFYLLLVIFVIPLKLVHKIVLIKKEICVSQKKIICALY